MKSLPLKLTDEPCVRWPPLLRFIARMVSPGLMTLRYAAMFACEPLCGWTFTW